MSALAPTWTPRPATQTDPASGLTISGLTMSYGPTRVLHGIDLEVAAGELVTVLGSNGSGKSTMLRCIAGLEQAEGGQVLVGGAPRTASPTAVAMIFQKIDLVGRYSALDNVCSGALGRLHGVRGLHRRLFPTEVREEAMACLAEVGLADRAHDPVRRLSGGQQQRVAVARALCQRPTVLLADEPVSALDPSAAEQVMGVLTRVAHSRGLAVLAVLHQPDIARRHSDRLIGFRSGRLAFAGTPATIDSEQVDALYRLDGDPR